jgi:hypothetical protein
VQINIETESARLLDWLYGQPLTPVYYDVNDYVRDKGFPDESARLLVEYLARRGLVMPAIGLGDEAAAIITSEGISYVQQLRSHLDDPVKRVRQLHAAMLLWLFEQERVGQAVPNWAGFVATAEREISSSPFTASEVDRAADYLAKKRLITGPDVDQHAVGVISPRLTHTGQDCVVDYGGDVAEYSKGQPRTMTTNYNHVAGNSNNVMVGSDNSQQHVSVGVDTEALVKFATVIRDSMPALGLPTEKQEELRNQAQELDELANSTNPPKGRIRQLVDALMAGLTLAATPLAETLATGIGNDALRALGH